MPPSITTVLVFLLPAVPISITDLRERRVPNVMLAFGLLVALWSASRADASALFDASRGAVVGFLFFWCVWRLSRGRIGMGDVKYAILVGAFTGTVGLCAAVFVASAAGLAFALAVIAIDRRKAHVRIPFAPFLSLGCAAEMIARCAAWPELFARGIE